MLKLLVALISCLTFSVPFGTVSRAQQAAVRAIIEPTERPGLELWLDKDCYEAGESLVIHFKSERDGYLTLWSIDPAGTVSVIWPNQWHPDGFIHGGVEYTFPGPDDPVSLKVTPPAGASPGDTEVIWGVVSSQKLPPPDPGSKGAVEWAKKVRIRLQNLPTNVWWASKTVEFRYGPCEEQPTETRSEKRALLVGINDYMYGVRDIAGAVNGVKLLQQALKSFGYETMVLFDHEATKANIKKNIMNFLGRVPPTGTALFVYCGHGASVSDVDGDELDRYDEALVPADCDPFMGSPLILDEELARWLINLPAGRILAILGSCHSGSMLDLTRGPRKTRVAFPYVTSRSGHVLLRDGVISDLVSETRGANKEIAGLEACGPMEVTYGIAYPNDLDHFPLPEILSDARLYDGMTFCSVMFRWLWDGLHEFSADRNADGRLTVEEIYKFIYPQVVKTTAFFAAQDPDCDQLAREGISCISHPVLETNTDPGMVSF